MCRVPNNVEMNNLQGDVEQWNDNDSIEIMMRNFDTPELLKELFEGPLWENRLKASILTSLGDEGQKFIDMIEGDNDSILIHLCLDLTNVQIYHCMIFTQCCGGSYMALLDTTSESDPEYIVASLRSVVSRTGEVVQYILSQTREDIGYEICALDESIFMLHVDNKLLMVCAHAAEVWLSEAFDDDDIECAEDILDGLPIPACFLNSLVHSLERPISDEMNAVVQKHNTRMIESGLGCSC